MFQGFELGYVFWGVIIQSTLPFIEKVEIVGKAGGTRGRNARNSSYS